MPTIITRGAVSAKAYGFGVSGGYSVSKSLRFRSSASAYLNRTPASATNRKTWTWSGWVKLGTLSVSRVLFGAGQNSTTGIDFGFLNDNTFFYSINGVGTWTTTAVFRDPSAWYHVVFAFDSTQATQANRSIVYINGVNYAFSSNGVVLNNNYDVNNNIAQYFGYTGVSGTPQYLDGYMAEVNFVDGQALTPSSFGTYDTNGIWQPIKYSGTYGTNGFYLPFSLNSTSSYAGSFNGTSQSLATTSGITNQFTPTSGFTLEMWAYQNNSGSNQGFYVGGGANSWSTSNGYLFGLLFGSAPQWQWNNAGATFTIGFSIPANQWAHIAIGYNGTTTRVWVNGISVGTSTSPYTIPSTVNQYVIGSNIGATSNYYTGNLSNLRFVKGTDVYGVGNATIAVPTGPLTAITNTQLLTLQNSTVIDNSTNAFTITNTGSVTTATATPFVENIFADASGNNNTWAGNNINYSTAGSTYDSMNDSPTVTSATVANYAVLNPVGAATYASLTSANLKLTGGGSTWNNAPSTIAPTSGKWYYEVTTTSWGTTTYSAASVYQAFVSGNLAGSTSSAPGWSAQLATSGNSSYFNANAATAVNMGSWVAGDICNVAVDISAGKIWFGRNGVWYNISGTTYTNTDVAAGNGYAFNNLATNTPTYMSGAVYTVSGNVIDLNFGQRPFSYTPPTGFNALNTYNLPTPTIANGAQYMAATTYTGTGATQTISDGGNNTIGTTFQPDLVWIKSRSAATNNNLFDVLRGTTAYLISNSTATEATNANTLTAFGSTGFTVGSDASAIGVNVNAATYVGWQWKANGAGVTNTNGSITSTVSANTTAGFGIVTYTGTGANATIGHGLGVAPNMVITKSRNLGGSHWTVYHSSVGNTGALLLDTTAATNTSINYWNNTSPTSSVFSVGIDGSVNNSGNTFVAYCWAAVPGYSAFGSYTGNGSTDGPFVYTGFRPRYVLVKETVTVSNWNQWDSSRNPANLTNLLLRPNSSGAESVSGSTDIQVDFLANGFKIRGSSGDFNTNGELIIYAAFAENPFQNSRAR